MRARFIAPWKDSTEKPAIYHCVSRVVDRRFAFKSVLVEDGVASRTVAPYIDLNPVRAGMVSDPGAYRWSSYGEPMSGGPARSNGKKARAGLVRAIKAHKGYEADARHWAGNVSREYRMLLLAEAEEKLREVAGEDGKPEVKVVRKGMKKAAVEAELTQLDLTPTHCRSQGL